MTLESDRDLLDAFRRGETDALARVYRLYVQDVARTLRAGVSVRVEGRPTRIREDLDALDIESLLQDVFVRAFAPAARASYDGVRPFGAYLAAIARNLLVDRARSRRREVSLGDAEDSLEGEAVDPVESIEARALAEVVERFRTSLAARERAIFDARYKEGLALRPTAERLGLSLITVRRVDAQVRHALLAAVREAGFLLDVEVGIPSTDRDRSKG
jgi:RNA polymerase sigma-70 factor (ECF subfamily)